MSKYHPVRPKKHRHKHQQVPQPAAPDYAKASSGRPTIPDAQAETLALERIEKTRIELYRLRNGDILDASIARWKRMLTIYDREAEVVFSSDMSKPHRWTVSPAMALRAEKHLESLLARQAELMDECHAEAHALVSEYYAQAGGDSLCPPKQTPAPQPGPGAVEIATSNPSTPGGDPPDPLKPVA